MPRKPRRRGWGQGNLEQLKSGYWRIRWHEGGRRRSAKYADQGQAQEVLAKILADVRAGRASNYKPPTDTMETPTLAELAKKWLARREHTHRNWRGDRNLWNKHLEPIVGHLRAHEVDQATVRRLVEAKLVAGLSSQSVGNVVRLLSTFYTDLIEQRLAQANPGRGLPKSTRRLIKSTHDPRQTAFIEKQSDIARIYSKLDQPFAAIFAVGALAGLRPGEIIGLEWGDVDIGARRLLVQRQVRHGRVGPTKSGKPRLVPIIEPLAKILAEWKLATGGEGLLFKPLNPWRKRSHFIKDAGVREAIRGALKKCGLPETWTWYAVGRHTYASQHVMGGGSLATLREILGHSSVVVTERYAHLRPDLFKPEDLLKLSVGMSREGGAVIDLAEHRGTVGQETATVAVDGADARG